jgi:putative spermidine/putrescine transport system ATP-binding protein
VGEVGESDAAAGSVELRGVVKRFGEVVAVDGVDLRVEAGEFFSLLGPSGSGKTTVLRMIAGFELPTAGEVMLGGRDVTNRPPYDRDVNTVFQDYALFPHLNVAQNVEYGLKVKGIGRGERRRRAGEMLDIVRLGSFGERRPDQLSGGQRQRVALARALVNRPKVLLLDEPLGALDLKLREEMQTELKAIQREVGITFIYVTHDQGEALSMSTRIAVFNSGHVEQIGAPAEVYDEPTTSFVAGFVGTANLVDAEHSATLFGVSSVHSIRPERITLSPPPGDRATGTVVDVQYLGAERRTRIVLDIGGHLVAAVPADRPIAEGDRVGLQWPSDAVRRVADTGDVVPEDEAVDAAPEPSPPIPIGGIP